jgi:hypothetical protein
VARTPDHDKRRVRRADDVRPRISCPRCSCEVGFGREPENRIANPYDIEERSGDRAHIPINDEPVLAFDRDCACSCHEAWRLAMSVPV